METVGWVALFCGIFFGLLGHRIYRGHLVPYQRITGNSMGSHRQAKKAVIFFVVGLALILLAFYILGIDIWNPVVGEEAL